MMGLIIWAECSFCKGEIRGKVKDKEPLSRNKVSFWSRDEKDQRIIWDMFQQKEEKY
jgi:hypothetical protein